MSIRYTERLAEAGIEPSVCSVGDSYDNALAETIIGLYKTEVIHQIAPWRNVDHVEFETLDWVDWFNNQRLRALLLASAVGCLDIFLIAYATHNSRARLATVVRSLSKARVASLLSLYHTQVEIWRPARCLAMLEAEDQLLGRLTLEL